MKLSKQQHWRIEVRGWEGRGDAHAQTPALKSTLPILPAPLCAAVCPLSFFDRRKCQRA